MQILTNTPVWVFALFFVLVYFGFKQSRSRMVKRRVAYLLPAGMVALSLAGISSSFSLGLETLTLWLAGVSLIAFTVFRFFPLANASYDTLSKRFHLAGSWVPLLVMMAIFFTKYAVAVMQGMHSALVELPYFMSALCFCYGCYSGYFVSRALSLAGTAKRAHQAS